MRTAAEQHLISRIRLLLKQPRTYETTIGIVLAAMVGVSAGLGAVAFRELISLFQWLFFN